VEVPTYNKAFYGRVWGNEFLEFIPNYPALNNSVTYTLSNVLSNIGYDIYLVTVPALAKDTLASSDDRLPTLLKCTLTAPGMPETVMGNENDPRYSSSNKTFMTTPDSIDYFLLAEDFKFPKCTYGIADESFQALLKIETKVSSSQLRKKTHTRTMRINCVLLVPHGSLEVVDALPAELPASFANKPGIMMYPHGKYDDRAYKGWYMLR
jgi:hypothetical protein